MRGVVGAREMVAGMGILTGRWPVEWMWARVAGDLLDVGMLSAALRSGDTRKERVAAALASVGVVTALDVACSVKLTKSRPADDERFGYGDQVEATP
jgi:hypothetical protein